MGKIKYYEPHGFIYHSKRYDKDVTVPKGEPSDGATFAPDIYSRSWKVHDVLCKTGMWDDGTKCTNWQASMVLAAILWREKQWLRTPSWFFFTFTCGGGKARENGMFKLRKD
jgi:hypothetical protein